jgi:hypothetical protein
MNVPPVPEGRRPPGNPPIRAYNARVLYSTSLEQAEKGYELFVGIRSLVPGPSAARPPTAVPAVDRPPTGVPAVDRPPTGVPIADRPPTAVPAVNRLPNAVPEFVRSLGPSPEITRIPAAGAAAKEIPSSQKTEDGISTTSSKATDHASNTNPEPNTEESDGTSSDTSDQSSRGEPPGPLSIPGSPGYTSTTCSSIPSHLSYVEPPFSEAASDVPDDISEWSDSSPVKESQAEGDDYGWSNIFTGTPEERRLLVQQLSDLCDRAEREGMFLVEQRVFVWMAD